MSSAAKTTTTPCRIYIRLVTEWGQSTPVHPTWDDTFVIVHVDESTSVRDCVIKAIAVWRKGVLPSATVYFCDKHGFVSYDAWSSSLAMSSQVLSQCEGRPRPYSLCILSAPPFGTSEEDIRFTQNIISCYISTRLGIPGRALQKEVTAHNKRLHEEVRIPNVEAILRRQAYNHQQSILVARREEDTRVLKLKEVGLHPPSLLLEAPTPL